MRTHLTALAVVTLLGVCTCSGRGLGPGPREPKNTYAVNLPARQGKLENGLRVIVLPDPTSALVEIDVRYFVGAANDPAGKAGLAHLVEHLMFQHRPAGPDRPPLMAAFRQVTVAFNAATDLDSTHYMNLARREELADVMALEAVRMGAGCATIDAASFEREREVVRNEVRQSDGSPAAAAWEQIVTAIYPARHPYARSIGGADADVAGLTLEDACAFIARHYVPANAVLVIAGGVSYTAVETLLGDFAELPARAAPAPARAREVAAHSGIDRLVSDLPRTLVSLSWPLPPRFADDDVAAEFLVALAQERLVGAAMGWKWASGATVQRIGGERAPTLVMALELTDDADVDDAIVQIKRVAAKLSDTTWWVRQLVLATLALELEDLGARTDLFADYAQFDLRQEFFAGQLRRLDALEPEVLQAFIKEATNPKLAHVVVLRPRGRRGGKPAAALRDTGAAHEVRDQLDVDPAEARLRIAVPKVTRQPQTRRFVLENGLRVVLEPTDGALPVLTATLVISAGTSHEPADLPGVAELAAFVQEVLPRTNGGGKGLFGGGAEGRSEGSSDGLVDDSFQTGDNAVTADRTLFTRRGLTIKTFDVLRELSITGDELRSKEVDRLLEKFRELDGRGADGARGRSTARVLAATMFGADHPYARVRRTAGSLKAIRGADIVAFLRDHYTAANTTLVVAGQFDPELAEEYVRSLFRHWRTGTADPPVAATAKLRSAASYVGVGGDDDSLVDLLLAYPAPAGVDGQFAARLVLAEMLAGRARAVREELGASYGVSARLVVRAGPSMYLVEGQIDAQRAGEALALLRAGIAALQTTTDFDADFVRARRTVLQQLIAESSSSAARASALAFNAAYGLADDHQQRLVRLVAALSPEQVRDLASAELTAEHEVLVLRGVRAQVEQALQDAGLTLSKFLE